MKFRWIYGCDVSMLHLLDVIGFFGLSSVQLWLLSWRLGEGWFGVRILGVEVELNIFVSGFGRWGLRDPAVPHLPIVSDLIKEGLSDLLNTEVLRRCLKIEVDLEWGVHCLWKLPHIVEVGIGEELLNRGSIERIKLEHLGQQIQCFVATLRVALSKVGRWARRELLKVLDRFFIGYEAHIISRWRTNHIEN